MKPNPVKQKLRWGEVTYGTWLTMGDLYGPCLLYTSDAADDP